MANKISPADLAKQFKWDIYEIGEFCASALEEANDHTMAAALRAVNVADSELACEFIRLEADHVAAGHLTPELQARRNVLMDRLREARGE